jgi:hypothetical protein
MAAMKQLARIGALTLSLYALTPDTLAQEGRHRPMQPVGPNYIIGEPVKARLNNIYALDVILNDDGREVFASTATGDRRWDILYRTESLETALKMISDEINDGDKEPILLQGYWFNTGRDSRFIIDCVGANGTAYYLKRK